LFPTRQQIASALLRYRGDHLLAAKHFGVSRQWMAKAIADYGLRAEYPDAHSPFWRGYPPMAPPDDLPDDPESAGRRVQQDWLTHTPPEHDRLGDQTIAGQIIRETAFEIPRLPSGSAAENDISHLQWCGFVYGLLNGLPENMAATRAGIPHSTIAAYRLKGARAIRSGLNTDRYGVFVMVAAQARAFYGEFLLNVANRRVVETGDPKLLLPMLDRAGYNDAIPDVEDAATKTNEVAEALVRSLPQVQQVNRKPQ
jgi:hypothetical protein